MFIPFAGFFYGKKVFESIKKFIAIVFYLFYINDYTKN